MDSHTKQGSSSTSLVNKEPYSAPAKPEDETARLCTLHKLGILDSGSDERFDRLTRLARRLMNVPISIVSLVDQDRQWFKSCDGLDVSQTPRDISFCGHAILGDDIYVVEDASKDERFKNNPLVTGEPNIRFYAGCPLVAGDGSKLGTLCVIDRNPRKPTDDELESLKDLATMVEQEITAVYQASFDQLTQIANRRGFMFLAQKTISFCNRNSIPMTLVYFDLGNFKHINDKFGHAEGDFALNAFVQTTSKTMRSSDIFARIGGDEFVVLMSDATSETAHQFVSRTQKSIRGYNDEAQRGYNICFAHGVVEYDQEHHQTMEQLVADGDAQMYQNKTNNKPIKLFSRRPK